MTISAAKKPLAVGSWRWVVLYEGDEYTTNLSQKFKAAGKEGVSWKNVENDGKRTICTWGVGILSSKKEAE